MRWCVLLLCWGCCIAPAFGQNLPAPPDTSDCTAWGSVALNWRPIKSVKLAVEEQWRIKDNFSSFDRQFHQFTLGFSPRWNAFSKAQSLGLGFRHMTRVDDTGDNQGLERFIRWHAQHELDLDLGRWNVRTRLRFQRRRAIWLKDGKDPGEEGTKDVWRLKVELGHNFRDWKADPELSVERFWTTVPEGWPVDGHWRVRLGTGLKVGKRQRVKTFIQRQWRPRYLPSGVGATLEDFRLWGEERWTLGIAYRCSLKTRKKKE